MMVVTHHCYKRCPLLFYHQTSAQVELHRKALLEYLGPAEKENTTSVHSFVTVYEATIMACIQKSN